VKASEQPHQQDWRSFLSTRNAAGQRRREFCSETWFDALARLRGFAAQKIIFVT
jgi:hypothetical protein